MEARVDALDCIDMREGIKILVRHMDYKDQQFAEFMAYIKKRCEDQSHVLGKIIQIVSSLVIEESEHENLRKSTGASHIMY